MEGYRLVCGREVSDPYQQLLALHKVCFGQYEGVLPFDEEILRWFIQRPGLGLEHTLVVVYNNTIVSSLFLTLTSFYIDGHLVPVGIVDTVMTHPAHRGKGLASMLLEEAKGIMRKHQCWFGYLYTIPETRQFSLYQRLGYRDFRRVFHLKRDVCPPRGELFVEDEARVFLEDGDKVRSFLNDVFQGYDGFIPFDKELWEWRKMRRPSAIPAKVIALKDERGLPEGTLTLTFGEIVTSSGTEKVVFLSDWVGLSQAAKRKVLRQALSRLEGTKVDILCPVDNSEDWNILGEEGFLPYLAESAMLCPLSKEAEAMLQQPSQRPWYPLIESVVGV